MIVGFKAMAEYLKTHGALDVHHDTLRKAASDDRNRLGVKWDGGAATIEPSTLLQWRERRRGIRRQRRLAA